MKLLVTCIIFLLPLTLKAEHIQLTYRPQSFIVCFHFNNLKIYSDTGSVLAAIVSEWGDSTSKSEIKKLLRKEFQESDNDTISFTGISLTIPGHSPNRLYSGVWMIDKTIIQLIRTNKAQVIDSAGNIIYALKTRIHYSGTRRSRFSLRHFGRWLKTKRKEKYVTRLFINTGNHKELFSELLYSPPLHLGDCPYF